MDYSKAVVLHFVKRNCLRAGCFVCDEGDKYEDYTKCPYLPLKEIAKQRELTEDDIPDELVRR